MFGNAARNNGTHSLLGWQRARMRRALRGENRHEDRVLCSPDRGSRSHRRHVRLNRGAGSWRRDQGGGFRSGTREGSSVRGSTTFRGGGGGAGSGGQAGATTSNTGGGQTNATGGRQMNTAPTGNTGRSQGGGSQGGSQQGSQGGAQQRQ